MGLTKRFMEECDERGWYPVEKVVCPDCLSEPYLAAAIRAAADSLECDYCGATSHEPIAAPVDTVLELLVPGLLFENEDPVHQVMWSSRDGGWQMPWVDTEDLLNDYDVTDNTDLLRDLIDAITTEQWTQRDPYAAAPHEALLWGWQGFREHVTHRVRHLYLDHVEVPATLGAGEIAPADMPAALATAIRLGDVARILPAGTEWYRARPFEPGEQPTKAGEMGSPPDDIAKVNRMTPAGISAFYGATSREAALTEVRSYAGDVELALATFVTARDLVVIDLTTAPSLPSVFDEARRHERAAVRFLRGFAEDVAKPAHPDDHQHLDYVPTQVIAEYLRFRYRHEHQPIRGVLWRSSVDADAEDCVLFVDNSGCVEAEPGWTEHPDAWLGMDPSSLEIVAP